MSSLITPSVLIRLALVLTVAILAFASDARADHGTRGHAQCQEDQPCWNWTNHGNHRRGVVTVNGTARVVSVCAYQRLTRAGLIDHARSERMRGDASALRYPCSRPNPLNHLST